MNNLYIENIEDSNPKLTVNEYCKKLLGKNSSPIYLLVTYPYKQYWLPAESKYTAESNSREKVNPVEGNNTSASHYNPLIYLTAFYSLSNYRSTTIVKVAVSEDFTAFENALKSYPENLNDEVFPSICQQLCLPYFSSNRILELEPVHIPKPWGQEIWYTGIEERGVASLKAQGFSSPLPWVLSALPAEMCADSQQSLILLKILDPSPDPAFGDLYFELHQEKREVYVVTAIDPQAWPMGKGAIRFGFNQDKRREYVSDAAFKSGFLASVKEYEHIRRKIDDFIDTLRERDGFPQDQLVDNTVLNTWLGEVPDDWSSEESTLHSNVELFTGTLALSVGDVIKVPCFIPHSLQHGVRTIEFQTPVYERLIVSFNQKVQTQAHWDTAEAAEVMSLEPIPREDVFALIEEPGVRREKIVEFEDFDVIRIELDTARGIALADIESYCLIIGIQGLIDIQGDVIGPEQSALLTRTMNGVKIVPFHGDSACFLVAYPK